MQRCSGRQDLLCPLIWSMLSQDNPSKQASTELEQKNMVSNQINLITRVSGNSKTLVHYTSSWARYSSISYGMVILCKQALFQAEVYQTGLTWP